MAELREVQIGRDNLVGLSDCIVRGGILPERASELSRQVHVVGNVIVEGGVYAEKLEVDAGPVEFRNAVFVNKELHVASGAAGQVIFRKAVASADTVSAFVSSGRVIFGADVNATTVRLRNCYVGGSVFGTDVELEDCVVVGGAFASRGLSVVRSMVGTFHASEVRLFDRNYLLYPTAFSVEPMQVTQGASLNCLALADLGALYKGEAESEDSGVIAMDLGADRQRTVLVDDDGSNILVNSYSVATRVLASELSSPERLENHLLLTAGALGTQLLKTYSLNRADGTQSAELTVENISDFLFRVLTGVVQVRTMDGTVTFAELRERFG